eukprot:CAMPEP_0197184198 /NCGR_PEP_ID=MMETSP1423-20130617/9430_1 /TAXON_ID=476441 /ORGANISM="Pseudo-nitzschia heimii, Strain UNC1101" /LENGTH=213 /DNA_ID=CAMNT_0042634963 /DNA_START=26 /DNA_END=664 /DNA_ORIENTATION=+
MINFPRKHSKKVSALESSAQKSIMSSLSSSFSSFERSELSKDCGCDSPLGFESNAQHLINSSTISVSGNSPVLKAVSFKKNARVRRVRPRNQYTKKEREDMWYSDDEYADIKKQAVDTVKRMIKGERKGRFVEDHNYTARGLECRMKKNAVQRKEMKVFARRLVLDEQKLQSESGMASPDRLRKAYLKISSFASVKAQDLAQKDAKVVNDITL